MKKARAVVIGGGIHGLTSAIEFAKSKAHVTLIERHHSLLDGTSGATHNRAHMGYHYPRSDETAEECLDGLQLFIQKYPQALHYPEASYYVIDRTSRVSAESFAKFCDNHCLPYELAFPPEPVLKRDQVVQSFKVQEPVFNIQKLRRTLHDEARNAGVLVMRGTEFVGLDQDKSEIVASLDGLPIRISPDFVVNATYANTNRVMDLLGVPEQKVSYRLQLTEVAVVRSPIPLPALTIMDGKYISIMPWANGEDTSRLLVYDVENSVRKEETGHYLPDKNGLPSGYKGMVDKGRAYFPFMDSLVYEQSLHGSRPIPTHITDDSRTTRIVSSKSSIPVYSILEGKFISAPLKAIELANKVKSDGLI